MAFFPSSKHSYECHPHIVKILALSYFHSSILLGLLVALGFASAMSLPYTPMHAILPFLCLGIGIDDMFVIMQCLNNIKYVLSWEKYFCLIHSARAKGKLEQGVAQMIGATLR